MEGKHSTGSMPMPPPNHSPMTCGGPEASTSTIIYEKRGVDVAQEGRNTASRKPIRSEFPYRVNKTTDLPNSEEIWKKKTLTDVHIKFAVLKQYCLVPHKLTRIWHSCKNTQNSQNKKHQKYPPGKSTVDSTNG